MTWGWRLYFPSEDMRIFVALKNTSSRPGLNQWPLGPVANTLTTTPPRRLPQVLSCRTLTAEARVHARVIPRGICCGQSGTGSGFSLNSSCFPVNIIPPGLYIYIYIYIYTYIYTYIYILPGGWTTGLLVETVERHILIPSTNTWTRSSSVSFPTFSVPRTPFTRTS
jgi:hypothetical protein